MDKAQQDALKKAAGIEAAKIVQNGMMVGLGTGSTVRFLVDELGRRVKEEGLSFTGVTTSRRTQEQAEGYGITMLTILTLRLTDQTKLIRTLTALRAAAQLFFGKRLLQSTPIALCGL